MKNDNFSCCNHCYQKQHLCMCVKIKQTAIDDKCTEIGKVLDPIPVKSSSLKSKALKDKKNEILDLMIAEKLGHGYDVSDVAEMLDVSLIRVRKIEKKIYHYTKK